MLKKVLSLRWVGIGSYLNEIRLISSISKIDCAAYLVEDAPVSLARLT